MLKMWFIAELDFTGSMEEISEDQDSREWLRSYQLLLWYS
jgi:hypothetical protein